MLARRNADRAGDGQMRASPSS
ncbi:hypothetical protein IL54_1280 [Sphingobium sp. ba1]|nr:hypothetical protein IL54_1280 [Sphingobium sp. ba1]